MKFRTLMPAAGSSAFRHAPDWTDGQIMAIGIAATSQQELSKFS
ncbi:MAG: hypothetical protein N2423_03870 [Novosphingobium sp.]|nr:hypothetical protein [Novosphingobium sp.]